MLTLIFAGIVGLIIIFAIIIFIRNSPDFWFWLFLNLFFDPGGYVDGFLGGDIVGSLNISDVLIVGIIICMISAKIDWKLIFQDQFFLKFLIFLSVFAAYYYIAYGGIVPYFNDDLNYSTFLIKTRLFTYGFIILVSVYAFSLKGLKYFYTVTLSIGSIILTLYFITLLTGINLIPVIKMLRYSGSEMMRISMGTYGLFDIIFPLSLIAYLLSKKINMKIDYKVWLYYSGVIMLVTLLITLTRRTQLDIFFTLIIIVMIISYLFGVGKLSEMLKLILPTLVVIIALYFTFPKYVSYVSNIGEDVFLLLTTGKDSEKKGDYRVSGTGELETVKEYISNNIVFGTGYSYLDWRGEYVNSTRGVAYANAGDAAGEVPIYFLLFGYGIAGAILMLPLYFVVLRLFFKLIKLLKLSLKNYLLDPVTLLFSIYVLFMIARMFTYNLYAFSSDFSTGLFPNFALLAGIGFALYRKIYLNIFTE